MVLGTAGIILAGGQSRRMGRNKALLRLEPKSLTWLEIIAHRLARITAEIAIVTNQAEVYQGLNFPPSTNFVADNFVGAGPLAGLEAGLTVATCDCGLLVACDMPWLAEPLLHYLVTYERNGWDALVLLNRDNLPEPLCAVYNRAALPVVRAHLMAGRYKMADFLGAIRTKFVSADEWTKYDQAGLSFRNFNTPQDLLEVLSAQD